MSDATMPSSTVSALSFSLAETPLVRHQMVELDPGYATDGSCYFRSLNDNRTSKSCQFLLQLFVQEWKRDA